MIPAQAPCTSSLDALSRRARDAHAEVRRQMAGALRSAVAAGEALLEARAQLRHGEWLPWLEAVGIPRRTASRYTRLASEWATLAHLPDEATVTEALDVLAGKRAQKRKPRWTDAEIDRAFRGVESLPAQQEGQYYEAVGSDPGWATKRALARVKEAIAAAELTPDGDVVLRHLTAASVKLAEKGSAVISESEAIFRPQDRPRARGDPHARAVRRERRTRAGLRVLLCDVGPSRGRTADLRHLRRRARSGVRRGVELHQRGRDEPASASRSTTWACDSTEARTSTTPRRTCAPRSPS